MYSASGSGLISNTLTISYTNSLTGTATRFPCLAVANL